MRESWSTRNAAIVTKYARNVCLKKNIPATSKKAGNVTMDNSQARGRIKVKMMKILVENNMKTCGNTVHGSTEEDTLTDKGRHGLTATSNTLKCEENFLWCHFIPKRKTPLTRRPNLSPLREGWPSGAMKDWTLPFNTKYSHVVDLFLWRGWRHYVLM